MMTTETGARIPKEWCNASHFFLATRRKGCLTQRFLTLLGGWVTLLSTRQYSRHKSHAFQYFPVWLTCVTFWSYTMGLHTGLHTGYTLGNTGKRGISYILWPCILPLYWRFLPSPLECWNIYFLLIISTCEHLSEISQHGKRAWKRDSTHEPTFWREKLLCWNGPCKWTRFLTEKHFCWYRRKNHNSWWEKSLEVQLYKSTRFLPQKHLRWNGPCKWTSTTSANEYKDGFGQDFHPRNITPLLEHIKLSKGPFSGPETEPKSGSAQLKGK